MEDYIDGLSDEEKVEYLYYIMPTRWFKNALDIDSDQGVIGEAKNNASRSIETLEEEAKNTIKRLDLEQSFKKYTTNFWEAIKEIEDIQGESDLSSLSIGDLFYYRMHFKTTRKAAEWFHLSYQDEDTSVVEGLEIESEEELLSLFEGKIDYQKSFSSYGGDVWRGGLSDEPKPFIANINHPLVEIGYWVKGIEKKKKDERSGDIVRWRKPRRIMLRVDVKEETVQIHGDGMREKDVSNIIEEIKRLFGSNIELQQIELPDSFINYLEGIEECKSVSQTRRKGDSVISMTGNDVRGDNLWSQVDQRGIKEDKFRFEIGSIGDLMGVGLSSDEDTIRVFKARIKPSNRKKVINFLKKKKNDWQEANSE